MQTPSLMEQVKDMIVNPLDRSDATPLYIQLSESLVDYIEQNNLKADDPMPSQNELEKLFDVSQMTVRHALQRLAAEDRIYRIQGRGTFVAEQKFSLAPDNIIAFEDQLLNQGVQVESELIEEILIRPVKLRLHELKLPEDSKTYKIRRIKRVGGEAVCMEVNHLAPDFKGRFTKDELLLPFLTLLNNSPETRVTEIDYAIKGILLLQVEADYLDVPADTPALVKQRVMYSNTKPILAGKLVYLANKVEFRFKASQSTSTILTAMTTDKS